MSERLDVTFELTCYSGESPEAKAQGIALEQTVELAAEVISEDIHARMVGRIEELAPLDGNRYRLRIGYPVAATAGELTQTLNVLFGNISLKAGMRIVDIGWPPSLLQSFGGPRFGIPGLRQLTRTPRGPLLCSALKPMGMSTAELAERAYQFALGGVHIIKDDHGVTDQPDAPFAPRIEQVQAAIQRANRETGGNSLYFPNVTAGYAELPRRLAIAKEAGCRGVLINTWLTGLDTMRYARDEFGLALMAHPALTGAYFSHPEHGIAPELLIGDLFRLAGADASIYPNTGGRFGFTLESCEAINARLRRPLPGIAPSFPTPGGGMDIQRAPEWIRRYGPDTIVLIGGSLYAQGDLAAASRALKEALETA